MSLQRWLQGFITGKTLKEAVRGCKSCGWDLDPKQFCDCWGGRWYLECENCKERQ